MNQQKVFLKRIAALTVSCILLRGSLAGSAGKPMEDASSEDGPTNTYTPPVNEDGYIIVEIPVTLMGGNSAEDVIAEFHNSEQYNHEGELTPMECITDITANEDGSVNYVFCRSNLKNIKHRYLRLVAFNMALEISRPFNGQSTQRLTTMEYRGQ